MQLSSRSTGGFRYLPTAIIAWKEAVQVSLRSLVGCFQMSDSLSDAYAFFFVVDLLPNLQRGDDLPIFRQFNFGQINRAVGKKLDYALAKSSLKK